MSIYRIMISFLLLILAVQFSNADSSDQQESLLDINTAMMLSTFNISGNGSTGTCFILVEPNPNDPSTGFYVLFTAAHVLEDMQGEFATITYRSFSHSDFGRLEDTIRIRNGNTSLWIKHPEVDIAAMPIGIPIDADMCTVKTSLLATDSLLEEFCIHPGDELCVLGYPYGKASNNSGFPVLRSGRIASYPIYPTSDHPSFFLDFEVYPGNSGGPVYLCSENRVYNGATHAGIVQMLMGIVTKRAEIEYVINEDTIGTDTLMENINLAVVIHAKYMRELVDIIHSTYGI